MNTHRRKKTAHKAMHVVSAQVAFTGCVLYLEYDIEIGHGRIEKRECYLCTNLDWLAEKAEWNKLNAVAMIRCERTIKKTGKKSVEQRYFLTSLKDVQKAAFAMRAHWSIENNLGS